MIGDISFSTEKQSSYMMKNTNESVFTDILPQSRDCIDLSSNQSDDTKPSSSHHIFDVEMQITIETSDIKHIIGTFKNVFTDLREIAVFFRWFHHQHLVAFEARFVQGLEL